MNQASKRVKNKLFEGHVVKWPYFNLRDVQLDADPKKLFHLTWHQIISAVANSEKNFQNQRLLLLFFLKKCDVGCFAMPLQGKN